ncbi:MAG: O-acetyl-ADP-ribose deacetylase [Desulfobulbus propionicus]|nr:MAG: O-acetyl-ADP-ribose deacetylase [Desulfobulbus propionicus]
MEPAMISVIESDITSLEVDVIVNAANTSLLGGGGVDGAIHAAAGPELLEACKEIGGCAVGQAVLTPGFNLPAKHIIHTVGPQWQGGGNNEHAMLASCYRSCLEIAVKENFSSIAFPAISCGAYGFPVDEAADLAVDTLQSFIDKHGKPDKIFIVCFRPQIRFAFTQALQGLGLA